MNALEHPCYGTRDQLLCKMKNEVLAGRSVPNLMLHALAWFAAENGGSRQW